MPSLERVYNMEAERWGESPSHLRGDQIYIILRFLKGTARRNSLADPFTYDFRQVDAERGLLVTFDDIKQERNKSYYSELIRASLSRMGVPELYHSETLDPLFAQVEAAVSRDPPIMVSIYEIDCYTETDRTPAARSAVEGLERVRLDRDIMEETQSCAICWVDYEEQDVVDQLMLTRMPCSHYFHGDCILQWLQVNHLCPMCRYSMPVELQQEPPEQQEPVAPNI